NIHLVNPPPMMKFVPPSRRRQIPAKIKQLTPASGARFSSNRIRSNNNGGTVMVFLEISSYHFSWRVRPPLDKGGLQGGFNRQFRDSSRTLQNQELQQPDNS